MGHWPVSAGHRLDGAARSCGAIPTCVRSRLKMSGPLRADVRRTERRSGCVVGLPGCRRRGADPAVRGARHAAVVPGPVVERRAVVSAHHVGLGSRAEAPRAHADTLVFSNVVAEAPGSGPVMPFSVRCETEATARMFAPEFARRRCLVPVTLWHERARVAGQKVPHALGRIDGAPMAIGGIWEAWGREVCERTTTSALVTTPASDNLRRARPHAAGYREGRPGRRGWARTARKPAAGKRPRRRRRCGPRRRTPSPRGG